MEPGQTRIVYRGGEVAAMVTCSKQGTYFCYRFLPSKYRPTGPDKRPLQMVGPFDTEQKAVNAT